MQNTKIITQNLPNCIFCNSIGLPFQSNVFDPDGLIQNPWSYKRCSNPECNLIWLDPAPLETELWKAYTNYHTHTKEKVSLVPQFLLSVIKRILSIIMVPLWLMSGLFRESRQTRLMHLGGLIPGRLLDLGCGGGRFLRRMQRHGWEVEGIDFDAQATLKVKQKYGIKTYTGDLTSANLQDACFDAITMSHSIEHLVDPERNLRECLRVLKDGGRLVITTPNVNSRAAKDFGPFWRGWEPPRHLHLFTLDTIKLFLLRAGFEVEVMQTLAATAGTYRVSAVNQLKGNGQKVTFLFKVKLIFWSFYQELIDIFEQKNGNSIGQNLLVVATKPKQ
jgi:2-polyprenyl-3-methyl-5-hydroxy-6-metoxy-1,4-benzoquinol methylase